MNYSWCVKRSIRLNSYLYIKSWVWSGHWISLKVWDRLVFLYTSSFVVHAAMPDISIYTDWCYGQNIISAIVHVHINYCVAYENNMCCMWSNVTIIYILLCKNMLYRWISHRHFVLALNWDFSCTNKIIQEGANDI